MEIGVCSWSLKVGSVAELSALLPKVGVDVVQIACGDPHHASWAEGDGMPAAVKAAGFRLFGAMIGFPGEDYTTPQTIHATGGFGDPATRAERLKVLEWAVARARQLGQTLLTFHAGFIPPVGDPGRKAFLDTLAHAGDLCRAAGITAGLETGQETADLLKTTLEELRHPAVKVNFDPANMILYDMGDPVAAVGKLGPYIASVHAKDAIRTTVPGTWGQEVPLGQGQVNFPAFISALKSAGYRGPLIVEREVGDQAGRLADIIHGVRFLRGLGVG